MRLRLTIALAITAALVGMLVLARGRAESEDRVADARRRVDAPLRALFATRGLAYPPRGLYLRVLKREARLEMWGEKADGQYALVKGYDVCAQSGRLGPKRTEGDEQVPEGVYDIRVFNAKSRFHLSLGIDYPNASDRILGKPPLGGDIMIHGGCRTIGCVPIGDDGIEEVFVASRDTRRAGRPTTVHVFPTAMTDDGMRAIEPDADAATIAFWRNLRPAYTRFETTHVPPVARVDPRTGLYVFDR
jgi:murein L,D-transpeptidase YafK